MNKYMIGAWVVGGISGLIIWVVSLFSWGLLGFAFGWIPALFGGLILGLIWPLTLLAVLGLLVLVSR